MTSYTLFVFEVTGLDVQGTFMFCLSATVKHAYKKINR